MDEFTKYGQTFEEAKEKLEKVLQRCKDYNISLNSEKCFMMMQEVVVLGQFIFPKGIEVDLAKIEVIHTLDVPAQYKDLKSFLGHVGYYRCFIKDFSQIVAPLYNLLQKDAEFVWNSDCTKSFQA